MLAYHQRHESEACSDNNSQIHQIAKVFTLESFPVSHVRSMENLQPR